MAAFKNLGYSGDWAVSSSLGYALVVADALM